MLKGLPALLSPELLHALASMGHGDEIVISDGNFPADAMGQRLIRLDGHGVPAILEAILKLMPLDQHVPQPVGLMEVPAEANLVPAVWAEYREILAKGEDMYVSGEKKLEDSIEMIERFAFYERAKKAYAIIATGETAIYANVILKKGVVQ